MSKRTPPPSEPDPEMVRLTQEVAGMVPEDIVQEMRDELSEIALPSMEDPVTGSVIEQEYAENWASGKSGFYSFHERANSLKITRERMLEQMSWRNHYAELNEQLQQYHANLGYEAIALQRLWDYGNKRVNDAVAGYEASKARTIKGLPAQRANL